MSDIPTLTKAINKWVTERGWDELQKPKDLAISLAMETSEVLEHFQWKNDEQFDEHLKKDKSEFADELADVAVYLFKLADKTEIDLGAAIEAKLEKAAKKYPANIVANDPDLSKTLKIKKSYREKKGARA